MKWPGTGHQVLGVIATWVRIIIIIIIIININIIIINIIIIIGSKVSRVAHLLRASLIPT